MPTLEPTGMPSRSLSSTVMTRYSDEGMSSRALVVLMTGWSTPFTLTNRDAVSLPTMSLLLLQSEGRPGLMMP